MVRGGMWDSDRGIALLTEAISVLQATQSRYFLSYLLGLLADTHMKAGQHDDAMTAVDEGVAFVEASGERYYSAELHRLPWRAFGSSAARRVQEG